MKRTLLLIVPAFMLFFGTSCGHRVITGRGDIVSEGRMATTFDKVDISAPVTATITVKPGAKSSVELSGYKNLLEQIETIVEGGTLKIKSRDMIDLDTDKDLKAEIVVGSLSALGLHGSADAEVLGSITGSTFRLDITGAGDANVEDVAVNDLVASITGAGDVDIKSGKCKQIEYKVSGAGNISSFGVQGEVVRAQVSGAGDIEVSALKSLDARVSGAGTIRYKGQPAIKSQTSGIGEIVAAN